MQIPSIPRCCLPAAAALALFTGAPTPDASAQPATDLGRYFGFDDARILVADDGAGSVGVADIDGDGLNDLIIVNNRKSRIEIHLQRSSVRGDSELERAHRVNEMPPSRWYDRIEISVPLRVSAVIAHDVDDDGLIDLLIAGQPSEIVYMRQASPLDFEIETRSRVRGLAATRTAFAIADVVGDAAPELLVAAQGAIRVHSLSPKGVLGEPQTLGAGRTGEAVIAFYAEDFDGDGLTDVLGVVPEHSAPLRLWKQKRDASRARGPKFGVLGPELRFESPALREVDPIRFPDHDAASIVVIERSSRRVVVYDLATTEIEPPRGGGAERDVLAEAFAFSGPAARDRSIVVADIDRDGWEDVLAADVEGNRIIFHKQRPGLGLAGSEAFSAFKRPKTLAAGQWDGEGPLEVFVLSEEEKAVGMSRFDPADGHLSFPQPLRLATQGGEPVAMGFASMADGPALVVVVRQRRDHTLEIHRPGDADTVVVDLPGVRRPPQSILAADADQDGEVELLLLTPGDPMVMVRRSAGVEDRDENSRAADPGWSVLTSDDMPQFGLVQAAGPRNTALFDMDGDGAKELLIADRNYVRACAYDIESGWRVVDQITSPDASTRFSALTVMDSGDNMPGGRGSASIIAADTENNRLVAMSRVGGAWRIIDMMRLEGFTIGALEAGRFGGQVAPSLLAMSDDAFAVIRLAGERDALEPVVAWRSEEENRLEHEIEVGDLNGDGYIDMAVLDASEQMCSILTFSETRRLFFATEFKVFESRLFQGGQSREFQPSEAVIADVTGDGAQDLILLVHDRVMIYPQMTRPR